MSTNPNDRSRTQKMSDSRREERWGAKCALKSLRGTERTRRAAVRLHRFVRHLHVRINASLLNAPERCFGHTLSRRGFQFGERQFDGGNRLTTAITQMAADPLL
jgi:hypothetical protein